MLAYLSLLLQITDVISNEEISGSVKAVFDDLKNVRFTEGTTTGKADRYIADRRTLSASTNEDLDFAGGFTDASGAAVTCAKVKLLVFYNRSTTQSLTVKPATSNGALVGFGAASHTRTIPPGGCEIYYNPAGWTITAGTGDLFNVANGSGASCEYSVFGLGTSA